MFTDLENFERSQKASTTWTAGKSCITENLWSCCQLSQMRIRSQYRTVCFHIRQGEGQVVIQMLVQPVMGGVWWKRNYVQHSTNGVIPLHLTIHTEVNTDFYKCQFCCLCLTMFFIPYEETCGKSSRPDLSRVLGTAQTHANYNGQGWFRSSSRPGTLCRVCYEVMITMKTKSRSRLKKNKNSRGFGYFWGSVFLLEM